MKMSLRIIPHVLLSFGFLALISPSFVRAQAGDAAAGVNREALINELLHGKGRIKQLRALRALVPHVKEPEVKEAFVKTLDANPGMVARNTIISALVSNYASDAAMQDYFVNTLASEKSQIVRTEIVSALGAHLGNPKVRDAWLGLVKNETNGGVRLKAVRDLARLADTDAEVYELMLDIAKRDGNKLVRGHAIEALSGRLKGNPDLKTLFLGLLDADGVLLQYRALKGLVELGDPSLKSTLIRKAREILVNEYNRNQEQGLAPEVFDLLRRLDAREAEKTRVELGLRAN
jgi:HEAT repeat protein